MKNNLLVALGVLGFSVIGNVSGQFYNTVSLSGTEFVASLSNTNGEIFLNATRSFSTRELIKLIAADESAAGVWTNAVPVGTTLSYVGLSFWVNPPGSSPLSAANVLNIDLPSAIDSSTKVLGPATLSYDSTGIGGSNQFSITGFGSYWGLDPFWFQFQDGVGQGFLGTNTVVFKTVCITGHGAEANSSPSSGVNGASQQAIILSTNLGPALPVSVETNIYLLPTDN